jgi:peptidoglycan/LPS O-acetylase OafA/YrhL
MPSQQTYRPDIDGLRAIAVFLVIGFHSVPRLIPGGYVGVDIFFVISGFLITGLLLDDLKKKQFSVATFYARRIRRIFPALVPVIAACLIIGWFVLLPSDFSALGLNALGGAAFTSNFVLLHETGYFDVPAAQNPLLHLWSLGVEEQFYIVWPMLLFWAFSRKISIVGLAAAVFVLSFACSVKYAGMAAGFYLPLARAWELMIGGVIAAVANPTENLGWERALDPIRSVLSRTIPRPVKVLCLHRDLTALVGIVLIAAAVARLNRDSQFPGWRALLPALGAMLLVVSNGSWFNRTILGNRAAVSLGLISYPLYLWHWPLLAFTAVVDPARPVAVSMAVIVAAALLAWLTYRWIEQPIRAGGLSRTKIAGLCTAMAAVGVAGGAIVYWRGVPARIPPVIREIADLTLDPVRARWRTGQCFLEPIDTKLQFSPDCLDHGARPLLFLWGDSIAAALYPGLKQLQSSANFGLAQYTRAGCAPLLSLPKDTVSQCVDNNEHVFAVLSDVRPDIVLLDSYWSRKSGDVFQGLADLLDKLRLLKIPRVVVMGPPPDWVGGLPNAVYAYYGWYSFHQMIPARSNFRVSEAQYAAARQFRQWAALQGVEYISTWDALCDGDACLTRVGDGAAALIALPRGHLTVAGSIYLAQAMAPCLFPVHGGSAAATAGDRPPWCINGPPTPVVKPR